MAGEWRESTLGEFVTLQRGHDLTDTDRRPGTVPVMGAAGQNGFHDTALAKGPGVVVGRSGASFGQVHYCETDFWPHNTGLYVTDFRGNNPRFAYYFLKALDFSRYNSGSAQPSLNRNYIYPIEVQIPPQEEQRAIAHILGTLDDKIELNRRMNQTMEAMARALFKSWFVDFDPVRAKAASRPSMACGPRLAPIGEAERRDPGFPKPLADLFPDSFEDSELGEIPKGWEVQRFADTVDIIGGGTPKTSVAEYWDGDIPWFSVVDAPSNSEVWVVDTAKKITREGVENSSTRILPVGTTIISARGTVGRIALVAVPMAMNQSCYGLRGKAGTHGFFTYFATRELVARLQQHAHGSVFDTITQDTLAGVSLASPPAALIEAFEARVAPVLERIRAGLFASRTLAALRDTLLPKLISGELRVKDAEEMTEEI